MASVVISREDLFPVGTVVSAYRGAGPPPVSGRPPYGPPVATATVASNGLLTFPSLLDGNRYILYAPSPDRYLGVYAPMDASVEGGTGSSTYVWDSATGAYVLSSDPTRAFVGPTDPVDAGFTPQDGDSWDPTG